MLKSLTLIAAALAIAGAAHAEERVFRASVTVPLAGKTQAQIANDLQLAAREACRKASLDAGPYRLTSDAQCRADAVRSARAFIKDAQLAAVAAPGRIAAAN